MNKEVSFPIAKLLKEKGFEQKVRGRYTLTNWNTAFKIGEFFVSDYEINDSCIYAPTISEVVMWLYEKHVIWIGVGSIDDSTIFRHCFSNIDFNSPTEAYEAAIEYTLNNLI